MSKYANITHEVVHSTFEYDPINGNLIWKKRPVESFKTKRAAAIWNKKFGGKLAKSKSANGYLHVKWMNKEYLSHVIIWFMQHGEWAENQIDHKNNNRSDNRLDNLRKAKNLDNSRNRKCRCDSKVKLKGVRKSHKNGWSSRIQIDNKRVYLGYFDCPAAASFAYQIASDIHFGEFARAF